MTLLERHCNLTKAASAGILETNAVVWPPQHILMLEQVQKNILRNLKDSSPIPIPVSDTLATTLCVGYESLVFRWNMTLIRFILNIQRDNVDSGSLAGEILSVRISQFFF